MHLVLLSGGTGERLWPLSNGIRAKQFFKLLPTSHGGAESMLQRVYGQISSIKTSDFQTVTIVAGESQVDQIQSQLGNDVNIIKEPERRDTFPAISLAVSYLLSELGATVDETVCILPVDSYVDTSFFEKVSDLDNILRDNDCDIALLGAVPVAPSEKYGYILSEQGDGIGSKVSKFVEKPSTEVAQSLIDMGALWNCGVFAFKLSYLADILKSRYAFDDIKYINLYKRFGDLKKSSFDYEVVEKADSIYMLKYAEYWKDLGTWETLTEEMVQTNDQVICEGCNNTEFLNELEVPLIALGIEDSVIVVSYDGILVSKKGQTSSLKKYTKEIKNRSMFEEKRWGNYRVLDYNSEDDNEALTKKLTINKGSSISYQSHKHRAEIWTITDGVGTTLINGKYNTVQPGDVIRIEIGDKHGIYANETLTIIEVQIGTILSEDDIIRIDNDWHSASAEGVSQK